MVDRIRWDTVSYLPFYYVFFQFLLLTIFNLQVNILTTKDILSNLDPDHLGSERDSCSSLSRSAKNLFPPAQALRETRRTATYPRRFLVQREVTKSYVGIEKSVRGRVKSLLEVRGRSRTDVGGLGQVEDRMGSRLFRSYLDTAKIGRNLVHGRTSRSHVP